MTIFTEALLDKYKGTLLGLACGDAIGTSVEFCPRGTFPLVTDMRGGGPFSLKAGYWTDDTSMALCLAESLNTKRCFDAKDQMVRYANWFEWGYWSSTGTCFDIGLTTKAAIQKFLTTQNPFSGDTDPSSAGNGSIMRLAPIPMFSYPNHEQTGHFAKLSSRTTHAAAECEDACVLLAEIILRAFSGQGKETILALSNLDIQSPKILDIAKQTYLDKSINQIYGSGYVVESLEAALWCFYHSRSFEEAVLTAVNLGDDSDTTGAIVGQIAGAYYGKNAIPQGWLDRLHLANEIQCIATTLFQLAEEQVNQSSSKLTPV